MDAGVNTKIKSKMFSNTDPQTLIYALTWLGTHDTYMAFFVNEEGQHMVMITCEDYEVVSPSFVNAAFTLIQAVEKTGHRAN